MITISLFEIIWAGIIGLLIGSFLNVVILRYPNRLMWQWRKEAQDFLEIESLDQDTSPPGIVYKRSFCPKCNHKLSWYDNIPLIGYILLFGKCRYCKNKISMQYPLVELVTGLLFAYCVYKFGFTYQALAFSAFFAVLITLSGIDFKTQLLPDNILIPSIWIAIVLSTTSILPLTPTQSILGAAIGYMSLWSVFWLFKIITGKEGMGYGDFKLLALIGAMLGPTSILTVILISSLLGAIVGSILLKVKKESQPFAFGPYIAIAGIVFVLFSDQIKQIIPLP